MYQKVEDISCGSDENSLASESVEHGSRRSFIREDRELQD